VNKVDNLTTIRRHFLMKSGNLNFLEPSGPLQACDGTALPFTFLPGVKTEGDIRKRFSGGGGGGGEMRLMRREMR
jgi:hypothetical protein